MNFTVKKRSITPHERLSATFQFLSTGTTYDNPKFSALVYSTPL